MEERVDLDMDPSTSAAAAAKGPQMGSKRTDNKFRPKLPAQAQDSTAAGSSSRRVSANRSSKTTTSTSAATSTTGAPSTTAATSTTAAAENAPGNLITQEVINCTIQCMISQAAECERNGLPAFQTERMIMEEMGRCLVEMVDCSIRHSDTSVRQE